MHIALGFSLCVQCFFISQKSTILAASLAMQTWLGQHDQKHKLDVIDQYVNVRKSSFYK